MHGDAANKLMLAAKRANTLEKIPLFENDLVQAIISESNEIQHVIDSNNEKEHFGGDPAQNSNINTNSNTRDFNMSSSSVPSVSNTPVKVMAISSSVSSTPRKEGSREEDSEETQDILNHLPEYIRRLAIARNKRCLLAYEMSRIQKLDQLVWDNVEFSAGQLNDLSHHERNYLEKYVSLVSGVKGVMSEIDLGGDLDPPSDVFIDVRVLKDAGEIMTEYGVFNLTKDSQFFVRKTDVERLIQQGYLKQI